MEESQFDRFLFGIFSAKQDFAPLVSGLKPSFDDISVIDYDIGFFFTFLSVSTSDCLKTEARELGKILAASIPQIKKLIATERKQFWNIPLLNDTDMNDEFVTGLGIK